MLAATNNMYAMRDIVWPNDEYRLSEFFHRLPAGPPEQPVAQTVNNFVAAEPTLALHPFCMYSVHRFPAPAGQVC